MIPDPFYKKRYKSAEQRFLKPTLVRFFMQEFPRYFGKKTTENIVDEIIKIFDRLHPHKERMMPCLLYTSPSPRDLSTSRMPSSA